MLERLTKSIDRNLTFPSRKRPDVEEYWKLMSESERGFALDFIGMVSSKTPEDFKVVCILGGSISRQFDHKLFRLKKRKPHDIDLAFTAQRETNRNTYTDRYEIGTTFFQSVEAFFIDRRLKFKRNEAESPGLMGITSRSTQFITEPTLQMRSFDLVFFKFFNYDATETLLEMTADKRNPGIILLDERNSNYVAAQKLERKLERERYLELARGYNNS